MAGDHMQLQPFDLYTVRYEEEAELTDYDAALEVESILDPPASGWKKPASHGIIDRVMLR
ncbi:MAG: hypothetical protein R3B47_18540 [Bacteroidia bacterium]